MSYGANQAAHILYAGQEERVFAYAMRLALAVSAVFSAAGLCIPRGLMFLFTDDPVLAVYFVISLDEMIKLPAVYRHYKQYKWVKNLTEKENVQ